LQDTGEPGIADVLVYLLHDGQPTAAKFTDSSGSYQFTDLLPGNYNVVVAPPGYTYSPPDQGGDDTRDSDVDHFGRTATFSLAAGASKLFVDAGLASDRSPVALDDNANCPIDGTVNINALANDSDPDGDPLQPSILSEPANGFASVNDSGTPDDPRGDFFVYTPAPGFRSSDSFTYQVDDGHSGTAQAVVTIQVGSALGRVKRWAWQDDGDGLQGPGEHGLLASGFQADLYTSSGSLVASAPVDAGRLY
jgi:hypothetical protein